MRTLLTPDSYAHILSLYEKTGLNTPQIAARLNIDQSTVCRIMRRLKPGYVTPTTRRLRTEI